MQLVFVKFCRSVVLVASGPLAHVQSGNVPKGMAKSPRGQRTHQLEYIERWNQPGVLWQRRGAGLADLPSSLKTCRRETSQMSGRSTGSALTGQNTYDDDDERCTLNYNDVFVSLLWGSFRFIEKARSQANNDIKLFYFCVFLLKCLIYSQGSA